MLPLIIRQVWTGSTQLYGAALLSGLAVLTSSCSEKDEGDYTQQLGAAAIQPIIRGTTSGGEHDAVVVLTTFDNGLRHGLCSATVVAPNLILTARHCVSETDDSTACTMDGKPIAGGTVKTDRDPTRLVVFLGKDGAYPDITDESNANARGTKLVVTPTTSLCNHDIAFVVLDTKLEAPVAPLRLGPPRPGERLSAVGWGIDETGRLPKSREVRRDIPLLGIGPALYPNHETYGYGDHEFMLGESACSGDSGSPALAVTGAVVGIAARAGNGRPRDPRNAASPCTGEDAHAIYTHLSSMRDLVASAFAEAGEPMRLEGEFAPRDWAPRSGVVEDEASSLGIASEAQWPWTARVDSRTAGSCSISAEPREGPVEYAIGCIALLALLVRLSRRVGGRNLDDARHVRQRTRMPSQY
ncbi:MAG TPA: trypsin-like serine protease [Labilithrix sp.]|nr:trypsin-like serine protease [Labilithrix sp.]